MTDRYHSLTVVFAEDTRDDEADAIIKAIMMIKGVCAVAGNVADATAYMAEARFQEAGILKTLQARFQEAGILKTLQARFSGERARGDIWRHPYRFLSRPGAVADHCRHVSDAPPFKRISV